ncbi:hypothetical protein AB0K27_17085 [Micromonospora echinospora]|uniref:Uncharacterized protein n=1 Tax=Micromonospora echinospora TaxID=1877 RepID=A0ABR6M4X8_MICEC|nr:hypothetical protein [Micromonospora echinospora]MBB5110439.1 hypothetical protein [Micromonospora echinospora]
MAEGLRGVHAYWRVPGWRPRAYRQLAAATWLLSVLSWRRHAGPVELYADAPTTDWLAGLGWLDLYDRTTPLDDTGLDHRYDRSACFALPKLLALARFPDAVLVDTDAYLLAPLRLTGPGSHFAHLEVGDGDFYAGLRGLCNPAGVDLPDAPGLVGNTALFRAADRALADRISATGLAFLDGNPATPGRDPHLHMTVAEQVLATDLTMRAGRPVTSIFAARWSTRSLRWLSPPPAFGHLWNLKRGGGAEQIVEVFTMIRRILVSDYGVAPGQLRVALEQA